METLTLYHASLYRLPAPDIHHGRKNADFGQGFYLSDSRGFAMRWAPESAGKTTYINRYELSADGLHFISAETPAPQELAPFKAALAAEEQEYQEIFAAALNDMIEGKSE